MTERAQCQDEAGVLFRAHGERLRRSVRRSVSTSDAVVEDACAFAWMQLVGCRPVCGERIFAWLRVVAIREAIRLDRCERREYPFDDPGIELVVDARAQIDPDAALEVGVALEKVGALGRRQRSIFSRHVAGLSYQEISSETGDSVRTVERQLLRARRAVRAAAG